MEQEEAQSRREIARDIQTEEEAEVEVEGIVVAVAPLPISMAKMAAMRPLRKSLGDNLEGS